MKKKPIKLNPLQKRTLALLQLLAQSPESSIPDADTGEVTVAYLPNPHGDHVHIGAYVVSAKDISGFSNEAVWRALDRKGLIRSGFPVQATLTVAGLGYETGLQDQFEHSNH
ncbi:hypothetical protein [Paremcibacter congregatus]|uniref:hypothetical protein n=1 Tax=Paremcibacter congregatus TaxID=2043170 RepID=UPI0030EEF81C|tara:strand:- start:1369 stop:1704 length:336 start_codon:yes stop_codon:yes gene_type:complete